jgi:hypothetical protein
MPRASAPVDEGAVQPQHMGSLSIARRFCGPPGSGNGGYACGRLAGYIEGPATVRLMRPPPLEVDLDVVRLGAEVELRQGDQVIARAWSGGPGIEVPPAPDPESARQRRERYAGLDRHAFPGCFVCGVDREEGDGLQIHAGPESRSEDAPHHVACTWTPHTELCDSAGVVPAHFVWSALDCPSGWAFLSFTEEVAVLGEFSVEILGSPHCGREYIVAGWELGRDGRKCMTGSALYEADGEILARARATWITIQD